MGSKFFLYTTYSHGAFFFFFNVLCNIYSLSPFTWFCIWVWEGATYLWLETVDVAILKRCRYHDVFYVRGGKCATAAL